MTPTAWEVLIVGRSPQGHPDPLERSTAKGSGTPGSGRRERTSCRNAGGSHAPRGGGVTIAPPVARAIVGEEGHWRRAWDGRDARAFRASRTEELLGAHAALVAAALGGEDPLALVYLPPWDSRTAPFGVRAAPASHALALTTGRLRLPERTSAFTFTTDRGFFLARAEWGLQGFGSDVVFMPWQAMAASTESANKTQMRGAR
jgi:hypothetical protein